MSNTPATKKRIDRAIRLAHSLGPAMQLVPGGSIWAGHRGREYKPGQEYDCRVCNQTKPVEEFDIRKNPTMISVRSS